MVTSGTVGGNTVNNQLGPLHVPLLGLAGLLAVVLSLAAIYVRRARRNSQA